MSTQTRETVHANELHIGDDVIHPVRGRFTVAAVEDRGFWIIVTADSGFEVKASPAQGFTRCTFQH